MCIHFTYDCKPCKLSFDIKILDENGPVITPYQDIRCPHFKLSDHFDLIHGIINNLVDNKEVTFCGYSEDHIYPPNHKSFIVFLNNHHDWRRPQSNMILSTDDDSD